MQTRSEKDVPYVDQRKGRPLQAEGTQVEINASATGEGTHTRWIRPTQPQLPQETTMPSSSLDGQSSQAFTTPPPNIPTEPPRGSPLQKQERIGNPGIFNIWEDGGRMFLESQPSSEDSQGLDRVAYTARQHALAAQRNQGPRVRPIVGPTGTFVMPCEPERADSKQPAISTPVAQPQPPNCDSQPLPENLSQPLGPNGTHLITLEESHAAIGPDGTHLILR